jgi:hypothetical protein
MDGWVLCYWRGRSALRGWVGECGQAAWRYSWTKPAEDVDAFDPLHLFHAGRHRSLAAVGATRLIPRCGRAVL